MSPFAAAQITKERLKLWQKRNERESHACTPLALISVEHGDLSGQLFINTVEDLSDEQVLLVLERAVQVLRTQIVIEKDKKTL